MKRVCPFGHTLFRFSLLLNGSEDWEILPIAVKNMAKVEKSRAEMLKIRIYYVILHPTNKKL